MNKKIALCIALSMFPAFTHASSHSKNQKDYSQLFTAAGVLFVGIGLGYLLGNKKAPSSSTIIPKLEDIQKNSSDTTSHTENPEFTSGYNEDLKVAFNEGYDAGKKAGNKKGYDAGKEAGFNEGTLYKVSKNENDKQQEERVKNIQTGRTKATNDFRNIFTECNADITFVSNNRKLYDIVSSLYKNYFDLKRFDLKKEPNYDNHLYNVNDNNSPKENTSPFVVYIEKKK